MKNMKFCSNKTNSKAIKMVGFSCIILASLLVIFVPAVTNADTTLTVNCAASPTSANVNQTVSFISAVSGGNGSYNYTWSGACNGSSANCSTSFSTSGVKTANLTVTSGSVSRSASCPVQINTVNVTCDTNSDCGTNGPVGGLFCYSNGVYQNYKNYTCNNAGTPSSYCSDYTTPQLKTVCMGNQTCSNGACIDSCTPNVEKRCVGNNVYWYDSCGNRGSFVQYCAEGCSNGTCIDSIACRTNSECGTDGYTGSPFCQNNDVYRNYRNYTCNNPGTTSSFCTNSTHAQLQINCTGNQTCSNGSCSNNCILNTERRCVGNNAYWFDSCGNQGNLIEYCANGCSNGTCIINNCTPNTERRCVGNNIYWFDSCGNQGNLIQYCADGCSNGTCINTCTPNYQQRCSGNNLYWYDSCGNQGGLIQYCANGCSGNSCIINNCVLNYQQRCVGSSLYWYDSCGNQGGLIQYCANGCSANSCLNVANSILTVSTTVRNLTNGSGFASSVYGNPSDMVMYMITLQANGNQDVNNVYVRDTLPANLTYNNQMVVARSNNNSNNYSGDIMSGVNLYTIPAGQTVTITYQAQIGPVGNFTYGTTTLTDNVYTTSTSATVPSVNASILVTRGGSVLGASTVSTGLTNNFWVDSFLLPLLITLIGIWMWKSGMFFSIEKWLDNKKKARRGYKAEKELLTRIKEIKDSGSR